MLLTLLLMALKATLAIPLCPIINIDLSLNFRAIL